MSSFRPGFFDCPSCTGRFESIVVQSTSSMGKDGDLRPHFLGANPLVHFVKVCPGCGFVGWLDDFAIHSEDEGMSSWVDDFNLHPGNGLPPLRDSRGKGADGPRNLGEEDRALTACQKYMALAERLASEGAAPEELGEAYLRATWSARFEELPQRPGLRAKALAAFLAAADLPGASVRTRYLAAELLRLGGRFEESAARFRALLALPTEDEESVDLRVLASLILPKAEAGDAEDVEFRWVEKDGDSESGEGSWVEWTEADEERLRKEGESGRVDLGGLAEALSQSQPTPARRLPNGLIEL